MPDSFDIEADARRYRVEIDPGAATPFLRRQSREVIIICDAFFQDRFEDLDCPVFSVTAIESNKTLEEATRLIEAVRVGGLTRSGRIIAVGGGIIQDIACFVASVYMRGITWTYLPTTVLGMVDSCIGGKSSLNVGRFKNLAGTIHPPDLVLVDTDFVETLPMEHRAGGLCEAAKIAFARGEAVFDRYMALEAAPTMTAADLAKVVAISLRAKQWFIEIDEFDRKERLTLNYGHTFAHAIEPATDFAVNHGAAVGIGILCATQLALEADLICRSPRLDTIEDHLLCLLHEIPDLQRNFAKIDMATFEKAVLSDKKHTADQLTLVLPVPDADGTLPLSLRFFARNPGTMDRISRAVETVQRKLVA